ncbi:TPA: putative metallopeptidase, partial [Acinetobacter baumannii]
MNQIRPFPPTDFMDQAEEEEAIRLIPAPDL